jgi:hypothetical protein
MRTHRDALAGGLFAAPPLPLALDKLTRQWLAAFARSYLPGNTSTEQYWAGRVVRVDDVEHGVDHAVGGTPPLKLFHRSDANSWVGHLGLNTERPWGGVRRWDLRPPVRWREHRREDKLGSAVKPDT